MRYVIPQNMRPGWIYRMDLVHRQECDSYPEELQEPFDRFLQGEFTGWTGDGTVAEFADVDLTGEWFDESTCRCVLLPVAWWEELHLSVKTLDRYDVTEVRPVRWDLTTER